MVRTTADEEGAETEDPALVGLRDRALIGVMVYTFARINAVLQMKLRDYFVQGRRGWGRLHEKGGKEHEVPCHHNLEQYLDEYIAAAAAASASRRGSANHESPRTTKLYDRRQDEISLDEVERILI